MNSSFFQAFINEGIYVVPEKLIPPSPVESEESVLPRISFIGQNNQKIVILINDEGNQVLSDGDKDFLSKVLGAVKLTFNDIALINLAFSPILSLESLEFTLGFKKLISFGVEINTLFGTEKVAKYKIFLARDIEVLFADSLSLIQEDKSLKIKLWEELKKLFQ